MFYCIVGQDPSDSKSSRLHVDIVFRYCFHSLEEVYSSIDSSKMIGNSPLKSPTSTRYFSNSTGSSVTNHRLFPDIDGHITTKKLTESIFQCTPCHAFWNPISCPEWVAVRTRSGCVTCLMQVGQFLFDMSKEPWKGYRTPTAWQFFSSIA